MDPPVMWYEPPPQAFQYPWTYKYFCVPANIVNRQSAAQMVDIMKQSGNECMRREDYWDALWKYNNALMHCRNYSLFPQWSVLEANCAQACLKLEMFPFAYLHANECVGLDTNSHKGYYRRAEAARRLFKSTERDVVQKLFPLINFEEALTDAVSDYCRSHLLQENAVAMCHAIVLAVDNGLSHLLPGLQDNEVQSGFTTKLLLELLLQPEARQRHLDFLVFQMSIYSSRPPFDGSHIDLSQVLRKPATNRKLIERLFELGMKSKEVDIQVAVEELPDTDASTLELIVSKCKDVNVSSLNKAHDVAVKAKKLQLVAFLMKLGARRTESPKDLVSKTKEEGNECFRNGNYEEALAKYYRALPVCRQHKLVKEEAVIRGNCAQVCLKLKLYGDAYAHSDECISLDDTNDKGYYRRAEALKKMLSWPAGSQKLPHGKGYGDVVFDYCQSHKIKQNPSALCEAVILAVEHGCTYAVPKFQADEIPAFSSKLLQEVITRRETNKKHLDFVVYQMPESSCRVPFDTSSIELSDILKKLKAVMSREFVQKMLDLGMRVKMGDIRKAIELLPDDSAPLLELIISKCQDSSASFLNLLCQVALDAKKLKFVATFITYGAKPSPDKIKQLIGWPPLPGTVINTVISQYLTVGLEEPHGPSSVGDSFGGAVPPPLSASSQDLELIARYNRDGKECLQVEDYSGALQNFASALSFCQRLELVHERAVVHGNVAHVYLKIGDFRNAYIHSSTQIQLKPSSEKAFFRRAEALRAALLSSRHNVPANLTFEDVVADYCYSHSLKPNANALSEAIILAVNQGYTAMLLSPPPLLNPSAAQSGFCLKLFRELLSKGKSETIHLQFLVSDFYTAHSIQFDASPIVLSGLLRSTKVNQKLLAQLLHQGMKVEESDIQLAAEILPDSSVKILDLILSKRKKSYCLDGPSQTAMKAKKMKFVSCFIKYGGKPESDPTELLLQALKKRDYDLAKEALKVPEGITPEKIDLGTLIPDLANHLDIVEELVGVGVSPNGCGSKKPLAEVMSLSYLSTKRRIDLICMLLQKGAECNHLCIAKKAMTTPLHVATEIALESDGDTSVIEAVAASETFVAPPNGKLVDAKGQTPLHLAMKASKKRDIVCTVLSSLAKINVPISPYPRDNLRKRARDYLSKGKDRRAVELDKAEANFGHLAEDQSKGKKKNRKDSNKTQVDDTKTEISCKDPANKVPTLQKASQPETPTRKAPTPKQAQKLEYEKLGPQEKLEKQVKRVLAKDLDYFKRVAPKSSEEEIQKAQAVVVESDGLQSDKDVGAHVSHTEHSHSSLIPVLSEITRPATVAAAERPRHHATEGDIGALFAQYGFDFDGLLWEVEVTNRVLKFFKDEKKYSPTDRVSAARTIFELAEGRRTYRLAKPLDQNLYEAKMTKGGRILWEKAIQFSARRTHHPSNPVYTQVIRVWEIVSQHDHLNEHIRYCIEQINCSHMRESLASMCLPLLPQEAPDSEPVRGREVIEWPRTFRVSSLNIRVIGKEHEDQFTPAASMKEDEYNVTIFYSFSSALVKSVLTCKNARRDYPFKEWPKEHEIISLQTNEAILLLGRSGTGKTTCCLYRLWNEFKNYWDPERRHPEAKIPRRAMISGKEVVEDEEEAATETAGEEPMEGTDIFEQEQNREGDTQSMEKTPSARSSATSYTHGAGVDTSAMTQYSTLPEDPLACPDQASSSDAASVTSELVENAEILEDLHQVFLTKNYVLCAQMKKRFYDLAAAYEFLSEQLDYETKELPNSLTKLNTMNHAFPLFLTARQFYILLDNSVKACVHEDDPLGQPFFPRDEEGNLKVKIVSSDYDHEDADTLLDLEASESEDEEEGVKLQNTPLQQTASKQYTEKYVEVTSLYFKEVIWPKCGVKGIDPLLVWMEIQSFIKGSEKALRKGTPLSLEEYQEVGRKMAPNFADQRVKIYKVFQQYQGYCQNLRHNTRLFDECDLVQHLYGRLCQTEDIDWSVHCLYVDEVQDFTQAELTLLLHCCRDPNSMFFTGDTAQSIMRGIAFRFQDLRSSFYRIHRKVPQVKVPQNPYTLTINFRSHSGVLSLAGSIIDLLREFFRGSIDDHLPEEKGMFPGPTPVLIESCEISDLALLLSTNKREISAIEFGAHQVILVQSKETKEKLPEILQGAIVLTIFEAKGLEFDDVLLYNFFTDSLVDEKGWRVVTSYLDSYPETVKASTPLPGSTDQPRSLIFDEKRHKSLNSELKYLYTAITRAKCNLWIYDESKERRLSVFDYWHKRGLVKVVGTEQERQDQHSLLFASNSTPEQWKVQGDYFKKKHMWEPARHCYHRAGPENLYLAKESSAYLLVHQARQSQRPQLYFEAAICFLECDELNHDANYLFYAALCLVNSRPPKHSFAAKLFEKLGQDTRAFKAYKKARDIENCARLLEKEGHYNEAVRICDRFNRKKEALAKATEFEGQGIQLEPELTTNELSYTYARRYARLKDKQTLCEVLEYMTDIPKRAKFLKEGGYFEEAYAVYVQQKQHKDAYRLASAQGWHDEGISLAKQLKDSKTQAMFIFQKIKAVYYEHRKRKQQQKAKKEDDELKSGKEIMPPEYLDMLHSLAKTQEKPIKAQACLLLGIVTQDVGLCITATRTYNLLRHKIGELEAFGAVAQLRDSKGEATRTVLDVCLLAKETVANLQANVNKMPAAKQTAQQAAEFYGFQRVGGVYYIPPRQDIWIGDSLKKCECLDKKDLDGMLSLDAEETRKAIAQHFSTYGTNWVHHFEVSQRLQQKLTTFKLHKEISESKFLSRKYTTAELPPSTLKEYIQTCIQYLELEITQQPSTPITSDKLFLLLAVFSPQVSVYLPLSKMHIDAVRYSKSVHSVFEDWIKTTVLKRETERVTMDPWLHAWRACSVTGRDTKILDTSVENKATSVNKKDQESRQLSKVKATSPITSEDTKQEQSSQKEAYLAPPEYVYWKNDKKYYHIFSFWLRSCQLVREGKPLVASKSAIYHFLGRIARSTGVFISVMNLVDILSIHCTALFAILTHVSALMKGHVVFRVPLLYKHAIQVFNDLNVHNKSQKWILSACAFEVTQSKNLRRLQGDCLNLLWCALDMLLGNYSSRFPVLKYALGNEKILRSGAASHCLVLALTLFGNLATTRSRHIARYQNTLATAFHQVRQRRKETGELLPHFEEIYKSSNSQNFPREVFQLVEKLLLQTNPTAHFVVAQLVFQQRSGLVEFKDFQAQIRASTSHMQQAGLGLPTVSGLSYAAATSSTGQDEQVQGMPTQTASPYQYQAAGGVTPAPPDPFDITQVLPLSHYFGPQPGFAEPQSFAEQFHISSPSHPASAIPVVEQAPSFPHSSVPIQPHPHMPQSPMSPISPISPMRINPLSVLFPGQPGTAPFRMSAEGHYPRMEQPFGTVSPPVPTSRPPNLPFQTLEGYYAHAPTQMSAETMPPQLPTTSELGMQPLFPQSPPLADTAAFMGSSVLPTTLQQEQTSSPSTAEVGGVFRSESFPTEMYSYSEQLWAELDEAIDYERDQAQTDAIITEQRSELRPELQFEVQEVDPTLVGKTFCMVCAVPLVPEPLQGAEESEEMEESISLSADDWGDSEPYQFHITSESHKRKVVAHRKFKEELEWYYTPLRKELSDMRQQCLSVEVPPPSLVRVIDDVNDDLEKYERRLSELQDSCSWEKGIEELNAMMDRMQFLLTRSTQEYNKIPPIAAQPTLKHQPDSMEEKAEEGEEAIDVVEELEEHLSRHSAADATAIAGSTAGLKSAEDKQRSREKKRVKRGKGNRN